MVYMFIAREWGVLWAAGTILESLWLAVKSCEVSRG